MRWGTSGISSLATAQRPDVAKRDYLKEARDGFEKWCKLACYVSVLWIILDILPHLPDEIGKKVADKMLGAVGL